MVWFRVDDKLHAHRKSRKAGVEAMGLWLLAGSWCSDQLADGFVPDYMAAAIDPRGYRKHAAQLVKAGLWVPAEHDGDEGWRFHQWEEHQPTAAEVEDRRTRERDKKRRQRRTPAGRYGGVPDPSPEESPGDETDQPAPDQGGRLPEIPRADVMEVCDAMAASVAERTGKRPPVSKGWRDAARLMLDRDGIPLEHVLGAIRWSASDEFWRSNVLSVPKLREQYPRLKLQAERGPRVGPGRHEDGQADLFARMDQTAREFDQGRQTA